MRKYLNYYWPATAIILIALDQASKLGMEKFYPKYVTYNTGSAFSSPIPRTLVLVVSFIIIAAILYNQFWLLNKKKEVNWKLESGLGLLILTGAVGNLIDRIRIAKVIDFIDLKIWPVFNFADIYLSTAAVLIVWFYLIKGEK